MSTGIGTPVFETVGGDASAATATYTPSGATATETDTLATVALNASTALEVANKAVPSASVGEDSGVAALDEGGALLLNGVSVASYDATTQALVLKSLNVALESGTSLSGPTALLLSSVIPSSVQFTNAELLAYDVANKTASAAVVATPNTTGARPIWDYNLVINAGQSEENGEMSMPLLSTSQPFDNLMMGESTRCTDPTATTTAWLPVGGSAAFNPLVAAAWNWSTNAVIARDASLLNIAQPSSITISSDGLTITSNDTSVDFTKCFAAGDYIQFSGFVGDASVINQMGTTVGNTATGFGTPMVPWSFGGTTYTEIHTVTSNTITLFVTLPNPGTTCYAVKIAWYAPLDPSLGEDQLVSCLNHERGMDANRATRGQLVGTNVCVGGQSIAQLSKGATPPIFDRIGQSTALFVTQASTAGKTYGCHRILFGQGGSDISTAYATYLAALIKYASDAQASVVSGTGQSLPPLFEYFVLSGGNQQSNDDMAVSRAQVDAMMKNMIPNAYCVGPGYWSPDYYAHWSANGERWFGAMRAKIAHRVQYLNQGWKPLHVTNSVWRGNEILLNCHVPFGPLQIKPCWIGQIYGMVPNYGFQVTDSSGTVIDISSVKIVSDTSILIRLASTPTAAPSWSYANTVFPYPGSGNICDSDPAKAANNYEWVAGMPFSEDEKSLAGAAMTLENWLCPYYATAAAG